MLWENSLKTEKFVFFIDCFKEIQKNVVDTRY